MVLGSGLTEYSNKFIFSFMFLLRSGFNLSTANYVKMTETTYKCNENIKLDPLEKEQVCSTLVQSNK